MRRTTASLALVPLALFVGACGGGGGGSEEAFCDLAQEIDEDGGDPSQREFEQLAEEAPDEISDDIELIVRFARAAEEEDEEALEDFDEEEFTEAGERVEDFLNDECGLDTDSENGDEEPIGEDASGDAEFCDVAADLVEEDEPSSEQLEEFAAVAPDELSGDLDLLLEAIVAIEENDTDALDDLDEGELEDASNNVRDFVRDECGIDVPEIGDEEAGGDDIDPSELPDPEPAPELDDVQEQFFADACEDGVMSACDELFSITAVDSEGEQYAETCGGRLAEEDSVSGGCTDVFQSQEVELGDPSPPPDSDNAEFSALAEDCFDGDMTACDELFAITPVGSVEEEYGETCGGRVSAAEAVPNQCAALFGEDV